MFHKRFFLLLMFSLYSANGATCRLPPVVEALCPIRFPFPLDVHGQPFFVGRGASVAGQRRVRWTATEQKKGNLTRLP